MDVSDDAQAREQFFRDLALAQAQQGSGDRLAGDGHCIDCNDPIPPARIIAAHNPLRCCACQTMRERMR